MATKERSIAKPDINITPLVDVVLVLLIIFMVVMPQMEAGASVTLPSVKSPDSSQQEALNPATITVSRDGKLFLEKDEHSIDQLIALLRRLHTDKPGTAVVIKADEAVSYGKVRSIFKLCQDIGFAGASLQVLDKSNQKG